MRARPVPRSLIPRHLLPLLAFALALMAPGASAQSALLWDMQEVEDGRSILALDETRLRELAEGAGFDLRVPGGGLWTARIKTLTRFPNGDVSLRASLKGTSLEDTSQHSLVITLGGTSAHASLSSPQGVFQFRGVLEGGQYRGWLLRYQPVRAQSPADDYVSPAPGGQDPGGTAFRLIQRPSAQTVRAGEHLTITLEIANVSGAAKAGVYADIFFLLENTTLASAPEGCRQIMSSERTPVLSCALGDLAPEARRTLSFTAAVGEASYPLIYSTALVGETRDDLIVEVYRDVITDSDDDGVSDHNERLLGSDPFDGLSTAGREATVIDVLPVFAAGVDEFYAGQAQTRFNHLLAMSNTIYEESGVKIRLRQAGSLRTAYAPAASLEEDLRAITYASDAALAEVERERVTRGADLVVLLRLMDGEVGLCGLANLGAKGLEGDFSAPYQKRYAFSVVNLNCLDDSVLAHELGHNMGLVHSRLEDPEGGTFSYAAGYGKPANGGYPGFATVMAYSGDYGTDNKVFRFSNPAKDCGPFTAFRCGTDPSIHPDTGADAASTLNFVRHQIAAYEPALEQKLKDLVPVWRQPDLGLDAALYAGASADGGYSYRQSFALDEEVSVLALLEPDSRHLGQAATLHAVFRLGARGFFQFDADGALIPWENMDLGALQPRGEVQLQERMEFEALSGFRGGDHDLAGQGVAVFLAYRLVDGGELVFSSVPLTFRFDAATADAEAGTP